MSPIAEDADENAHIAENAPLVIKFKHANKDHEKIMVGRILEQGQGICHELFGKPEAGEEEEGGEKEEGEEGEGAKKEQGEADDILKTYPHKFVKEVVREKKVHFWQVPRLGCFMSIPLVYRSCLSEPSLDEALKDYVEILKQMEEQDKKRAEWEAEQQELKEEKQRNGEKFVAEKREWPEIKPAPFITTDQKLVICIDTLGQDRALTDDQKRFCLQTANKFKNVWEKFEAQKLTLDRNQRVECANKDGLYMADHADKLKEEEEGYIEDQLKEMEKEIEEEDEKNLVAAKFRLQFQAGLFKPNIKWEDPTEEGGEKKMVVLPCEWRDRLELVKNYKVIKHGRALQALFYFLEYTCDGVVEPGTQKFFWKTAKNMINDAFIEKMLNFQLMGQKTHEFKKYQKINYIDKLIDGITNEQVDEFSITVGRLFRWLKLAIDNRKHDIIRRRALIHKDRQERDFKLKSRDDRAAKRQADLENEKAKFLEENKEQIEIYEAYQKAQGAGNDDYGDEEEEEGSGAKNTEIPTLPVFNVEEFLAAWDQEMPEIEVADVKEDDIDNDWDLTQEEIDDHIKKFWSRQEN